MALVAVLRQSTSVMLSQHPCILVLLIYSLKEEPEARRNRNLWLYGKAQNFCLELQRRTKWITLWQNAGRIPVGQSF